VIVYKIVTDCIVTGCPQNKKNEGKGILLLDFELFIGAYKGVLPKYVEVSNISPYKETSNTLKSPVVNNSIGESFDHDGQT